MTSQMTTTSNKLTLEGIDTSIDGRHAFVHERVLSLIRRESERVGALRISKHELAKLLGCSVCSVDNAIRRLRREGLIDSVPLYDANRGQIENAYRAL